MVDVVVVGASNALTIDPKFFVGETRVLYTAIVSGISIVFAILAFAILIEILT